MNPTQGSAHRLAVVTGGSQGLGATLAEFLAMQGYDLVIDARHARPLRRAAERLRERNVEVFALQGDVCEPAHRRRIVRAVARRGELHLLVHNASDLGVSPLPPLAKYPLAKFREVLETNVVAPLALTAALRPFLARAGGMVIAISSDAAVGAYPGWGAYGASKAAMDLMAKTLAEELRADEISVVPVDPGDMRTAMHQRAFPGQDISDRPAPDVTLPFWAWLLHQPAAALSGHRFRAQAEAWELPA